MATPRTRLWESCVVENEPLFLKNPVPQFFVSALSDSSVEVAFRAWVKNADYFNLLWKYTDEIKRRFDEAGITIPFPQRTCHIQGIDSGIVNSIEK